MPSRPKVTDTTAYINQAAEAAQPILTTLVQLITLSCQILKRKSNGTCHSINVISNM